MNTTHSLLFCRSRCVLLCRKGLAARVEESGRWFHRFPSSHLLQEQDVADCKRHIGFELRLLARDVTL